MEETKQPAVSVVLTSYNHKDFLPKSVDSILQQSFNNYEFIIWDDNSSDGSKEILSSYKEKNPQIKLYLNDVNSGRYTISTNRGASKAKGEYIIFEQCDDYADPDQIETLYKAAMQHPDAGMVFSASRMVDIEESVLHSDYDVRSRVFQIYCSSDCYITKEQLEDFLLESCVLPNLSAVLIRRDVYERFKGLDEDYVVVADWDFYLKVSSMYGAYYIRRELNNFRQHSTTIRSSVKMETQLNELMRMFENHFSNIEAPAAKRRRAYITVSDVWWSFFKNNPRIWVSSFSKVFRCFGKYGHHAQYSILGYLLLHPFRSLAFKLSHLK